MAGLRALSLTSVVVIRTQVTSGLWPMTAATRDFLMSLDSPARAPWLTVVTRGRRNWIGSGFCPGAWRYIAGLVYPVSGIQGLPLAARVRASSPGIRQSRLNDP